MRPLSKESRCLWSFCPLQTQVLACLAYPCSLSPQVISLGLYSHYLICQSLQRPGLTLPKHRHWFLGSAPSWTPDSKQLTSQNTPSAFCFLEIHFETLISVG